MVQSRIAYVVAAVVLVAATIALVTDDAVFWENMSASLSSHSNSTASSTGTCTSSTCQHQYETTTTTSPKKLHASRPPGDANCLVFFHIPKTAGTALGANLKSLCTTTTAATTATRTTTATSTNNTTTATTNLPWINREWYSFYDKYGSSRPPTMLPPTHSFHDKVYHTGHLTRPFLHKTGTERCKLITLLREPVDRAISAFYYHSHATPEWDDCLFSDATRCNYYWQYRNDMVRFLAGQGPTWTAYDAQNYYQVPVNDTSLQLAQQFLLDMDLVCFQSNLEECTRQLRIMLLGHDTPDVHTNTSTTSATMSWGIKNSDAVNKRNVNRKRPNLTGSIIYNKVRAVNRWDVDLYQWALQQPQFQLLL